MPLQLTLTYLIASVVYIATLGLTPYMGQFAIKAFPIAILFVYALLTLRGSARFIVAFALLASLIGDVFLALPIENSFIYGLVSFFIAHLAYIVSFVALRGHIQKHSRRLFEQRGFFTSIRPAVLCLTIVCFSGLMAWHILPATEELYYAVIAYIGVITLMGLCAVLWSKSKMIATGAMIFIISDAILAQSVFKAPLPFSPVWVMSTYYIAQYCLAQGLTKKFAFKHAYS